MGWIDRYIHTLWVFFATVSEEFWSLYIVMMWVCWECNLRLRRWLWASRACHITTDATITSSFPLTVDTSLCSLSNFEGAGKVGVSQSVLSPTAVVG